ncbi:MAG TPA: hypothetical protein VLD19_13220, partial [Chitinophagaceae bacterium]|nr:hypothetical protein [Chitinophagaceae bacterium]
AFTGMMRQLGGSFGIALIISFMSRRNMQHRNDLVSRLDVNNPAVQQRLAGIQHNFVVNGGMPVDVARQSGYQVLDYGVSKQAAVLSYMDVFLYLGVMFLICIPFVLLVRGNKKKKEKLDLSEAMH